MSSQRKNKTDERIVQIQELITEFTNGNYIARKKTSNKNDELDKLIEHLNNLGENLQHKTSLNEQEIRMNELLDGALKITIGDYNHKIAVSDRGDSFDALATALNTLTEELTHSGKTISNYKARIDATLEKLLKYTMMDFSEKIEVTEQGDELDAIAVGINTLIEELQSYLQKIQESEEKFRLLVEGIKDYAIYMLDHNGNIISWNKGAEAIKGYNEKEIIGKHISIFYTQEEIENKEPANELKTAERNGRVENEGWRIRKNGSKFWANVVITALYDNEGHVKGFAKITRDMTERKQAEERLNRNNWILAGMSELNEIMRGEKESAGLVQDIINKLGSYLDIPIGAIYLTEKEKYLRFSAGYAFHMNQHDKNKEIKYGEGLVGQAALQNKSITLTDIPTNYIKINTGLSEISPKEIHITPFTYDGKVKGIIEIGSLTKFSDIQIEFLRHVLEGIAITIHSAQIHEQLKFLLAETQAQSEELESQQEELKQINEELTQQRNQIQTSEEELRSQQEELEQKNIELQEKTTRLEEQNEAIQVKNQDLENIKQVLTLKAEELELTGKYKSEFLANMSHELRTPLNSILILAKLMTDNKTGNLTEKQIESANVIYKSGNDLLTLINEILDLSKIESGKTNIELTEISFKEIVSDLKATFNEIAEQKSISFSIKEDTKLPAYIISDKTRLLQVIRNILSNAFKFTNSGKVEVNISVAPSHISHKTDMAKNNTKVIAFSIRDTGIGIPKNKQKLIFEAFQQADTSTSRKYGGTGLGLTISREIISLLGGEISLESNEGEGSTFTIYLPEIFSKSNALHVKLEEKTKDEGLLVSSTSIESLADDRNTIRSKDKVILIIEDNPDFCKILQDFAHERNFKTIIANQGEVGLTYAKKYKPDAIILDIQLPIMDGWTVLNKLRENADLRTIPVHVISVVDTKQQDAHSETIEFLRKPITKNELDKTFDKIQSIIERKIKKVLLIEDDKTQSEFITNLLANSNIKCVSAQTGTDGLAQLESNNMDCVILDLNLPDISGFELLEKVKKNAVLSDIPFIIYTSADLTKEEENKLKKYSNAIILKTASSYERLLDEVTLFLHKVNHSLPKEKGSKKKFHRSDETLRDKKILLVDDDMRNIYALLNVLEEQDMHIIVANDGIEALEKLEQNKEIDLILMDIMMPHMDGYETMKKIREKPQYKTLPIIALTAKAMKGDREKCIEAGASDYIPKPVDLDKLFSLMRVWLYK